MEKFQREFKYTIKLFLDYFQKKKLNGFQNMKVDYYKLKSGDIEISNQKKKTKIYPNFKKRKEITLSFIANS